MTPLEFAQGCRAITALRRDEGRREREATRAARLAMIVGRALAAARSTRNGAAS